jgi:hypothetical protein
MVSAGHKPAHSGLIGNSPWTGLKSKRISVDMLNATNHTDFGAPNTNPTNTDFGKTTTQVGLSRVIQLNLRFEF